MSRSGGQILVEQLRLHGADLLFGVPGESYLAVLDALLDSDLRFVTCRHEAGAANMADAYGKLTGRPGIALVSRGPGATHAAVGVHTAAQDSTPLLLLVGQVARDTLDREAFQEIDYRSLLRRHREVVGAGRERRAHPGVPLPRLHDRDLRTAGPGRALAARGRARTGGATCRTRSRTRR